MLSDMGFTPGKALRETVDRRGTHHNSSRPEIPNVQLSERYSVTRDGH